MSRSLRIIQVIMKIARVISLILFILAIIWAIATIAGAIVTIEGTNYSAITNISASVSAICSGLYSLISNCSEKTSLFESVCRVNFVTNFRAFGVTTTLTFAPAFLYKRISEQILYAAIPPVIPIKMFFPFSIGIL